MRFAFRYPTYTATCRFCGVEFLATHPDRTYPGRYPERKYCDQHSSRYYYRRTYRGQTLLAGYLDVSPGKSWKLPRIGDTELVRTAAGNRSKTSRGKYDY